MTKAGEAMESDVAFRLRRAFADRKDVAVFNDIKICLIGETAQMDHLVVYPYGLLIIESKSVNGHVKVNKSGEWSRSYKGSWSGMRSPLKQAEMQRDLLRKILSLNVDKIMSKMLGVQRVISNFEFKIMCAVSSSAIVDRDECESSVSDLLVKAEFVPEKVNEIIGDTGKLSSLISNLANTRLRFSGDEFDRLIKFLADNDINASEPGSPGKSSKEEGANQQKQVMASPVEAGAQLSVNAVCKHCNAESDLEPRYAKFGYFFSCKSCNKNTPMKQACPACGARETRVSKKGEIYTLGCSKCNGAFEIKYRV